MKFEHKKSLGQNFISDKNLLAALAEDAGVDKDSCVLEIGPGLGSLTEQLSKRAKKVLAIETDSRLIEPLTEKFNNSNVSFIFNDFMKVSFLEIEQHFMQEYAVVANLPYYITTPILFRFFEEKNNATSVCVMVQKEVAERMVASPGSKDYGILSVACQHMGTTKILRNVGRKNFNPVPNVDSAFVKVELNNKEDKKPFFSFLRACFAMRRKTIVNNLKGKYNLECMLKWLQENNKSAAARAEELSYKEIYNFYLYVSKTNKI